MPKALISELLSASPLMRPSERPHGLSAAREVRVFRDEDGLKGKIGKSGGSSRQRSGSLGGKLTQLLSERRLSGRRRRGPGKAFASDNRQRVVVTVFPQTHFKGAAGRLVAHAKYLERDGAGPDGEKGQTYDRDHDGVDAPSRLEEWAQNDKRHFRLLLAPESGTRIDLKDFTRATMAQMERDLGARLEWVAVDHHNTDNPHVHVILRGVTRDRVDLILPRDYIRWGLRHTARDVATQMLGERGPEDERLALDRETRAERHTRLDTLLEAELKPKRTVRIQAIGRTLDPNLRAALRNRVRELAKMGLAREEQRGHFRLEPDWSKRLEEVGKGIDLRRRLGREVEPGQGRLRLYRPSMGRLEGEVTELGRRGEPTKGFVIVRDPAKGLVLANVRVREIEGVEPGGLLAIEPKDHNGRGVRVRLDRLSDLPIAGQDSARAETELDREIVRGLNGRAARLPATSEIKEALAARLAWHGHGAARSYGPV